jgi:spermidine synthase
MKSKFQRIRIFDTVANGRVLVLDNIVQLTTRDESAYAEMLTHLPLLEHGRAERVMIVGGGDLSIADEALKHRGVKEVVLVDIDGRVVELCREHFGALNRKAFADGRLKIEIADAFEYLGRGASKGRFDLIIADRPDPVGPGKALFGETFYGRVKAALAPGGFATFQTGVPFYQPQEIADALLELRSAFPRSGLYLTVVPTYIGGFMTLAWAGNGKGLGTPAGAKRARAGFAAARLNTDYYNPEMHAAAFALPEWIKRLAPPVEVGDLDDEDDSRPISDKLYRKAIAIVVRERKATTSYVQRRLAIGYNDAARLIERMEIERIISRPDREGRRRVLAPSANQQKRTISS